jgi:hypothetical protein
MKKTVLIFLFIYLFVSGFAQSKWKVGLNLNSNVSKYLLDDRYKIQYPAVYTKYGLGLGGGLNFYRLYGKHLMFKTGLLLNLKHYTANLHVVDNQYDVSNIKNYLLTLPLGFQYNFNIKQNHFFINTEFELSWLYKSVEKTDTEKIKKTNNYWNPVNELYFGLGYQFKLGKKYSLYINPVYSPQIFSKDFSSFRLNLGIIF